MIKEKFTAEETKKGLDYLYKLREKYQNQGQDFFNYLEGVVQSKGVTYWEYINLKSLLGLQVPKTKVKDEIIFITYHQITELYFKLIKQEIEQLSDLENREFDSLNNWIKRINRCNAYLKHICSSFDVMKSVMSHKDFMQFRMALLPASGFQSVQFRHIEIMSTNLNSLLNYQVRNTLKDEPLEQLYERIYWKAGAIDYETSKRTLTLKEFEEQYDIELMRLIKKYKYRNLFYLYYKLPNAIKSNEELIETLKEFDRYVNTFWRLSHFKAASRHLPNTDEGTGGTNWRKYLPPREQHIRFFDPLWSEEEKVNWGRVVAEKIFQERIGKQWMKIPRKEE